MTPADLEAFRARMGWTRKQIGAELDISQDRLRRLLDGAVPIPRDLALACAALAYGLPPMSQVTVTVTRSNRLGVKGVRLHRNGQYEARLRVNGKLVYLGCYRTIEEAKATYDAAALKAFGEFAFTG